MKRPRALTDLLVRFVAVAIAFALLLLMGDPSRLIAYSPDLPQGGSVPVFSWLGTVLLGVVAGSLLALASRPPSRPWSYRWSVAFVIGAIPLALLVVQLLVITRILSLTFEGLIGRAIFFSFGQLPFPLPATLLGIALAAGVVPRELEEEP